MNSVRLFTAIVPRVSIFLRNPARGALANVAVLLGLAGLLPASGQKAPPDNHDEVIIKMEQFNTARHQALQSCRGLRRYHAANSRLGRSAAVVVEMKYTAPDVKSFQVIESNGSRTIQKRAIEPLLQSEQQAARRQERKSTDISRENYAFTFAGRDSTTGAYIFHAQPHKPTKYLFRGDIWVEPQSFGIMRIEGEPAKSPSFWTRKTHFVHQYRAFDEFWFPVSNRTDVELLIFGKSTLSIDYYNYEWQRTAAAK